MPIAVNRATARKDMPITYRRKIYQHWQAHSYVVRRKRPKLKKLHRLSA